MSEGICHMLNAFWSWASLTPFQPVQSSGRVNAMREFRVCLGFRWLRWCQQSMSQLLKLPMQTFQNSLLLYVLLRWQVGNPFLRKRRRLAYDPRFMLDKWSKRVSRFRCRLCQNSWNLLRVSMTPSAAIVESPTNNRQVIRPSKRPRPIRIQPSTFVRWITQSRKSTRLLHSSRLRWSWARLQPSQVDRSEWETMDSCSM